MSTPAVKKIAALVCLLLIAVLPVSAALGARADIPVAERKVNVPGDPYSWYGTAEIDELGEVLDYINVPPKDPLNTFPSHDGKSDGKKFSFTLKTPKGGRYIFAFSTMINPSRSIVVRYRSGNQWKELPPARMSKDYFRGWDQRLFCYWMDIPAKQTATRFEIPVDRLGYALIATVGEDPFAGQPGGKHPSFEIPDYSKFNDSEVGKALLANFPAGKPVPLTEASFRKQMGNLDRFNKMPGAKAYIKQQKMLWGIAMDGLLYRATGDERYAKLAGAKGARVAKWVTWGYPGEWRVSDEDVTGDRGKRRFGGNLLQTSICLTGMALGYDLAADGMDPADRIEFKKGLHKFAHRVYIQSHSPQAFFYHDNWSGWQQAAVGLSGCAMLGENRYAQAWFDRFQVGAPVYIRAALDTNGGQQENLGYICFGLNKLMLAALAAESKGGASIFEMVDGRMQKFMRTIVYMVSPNGQAIRDFGDIGGELQMRSLGGLEDRVMGMTISHTRSPSRDGLAHWVAERGLRHLTGNRGESIRVNDGRYKVPNLLMYRPGQAKSPDAYDDMPLGWHGRNPMDYPHDNGYVFMRTGFDSPDDIKMVLKCGNAGGGHGHPHQGSFVLDAYGDFLSQSPGYNMWGRNYTRAGNMVTIDGKGQVNNHHSGDGRKVNDGHVERFVHSAAADMVIANSKAAYDAERNPVKRSLRYVLFVRKPQRRGYFVIADDMDKDGENHDYTWNFHTTANHRIVPDDEGFVAKSMTKAEALELWESRGEQKVAGKLRGWPGPSARHPNAKEVHVDLRVGVVWPTDYTHKITYKGADYKREINIPDHLAITQKTDEALFLTVLYPEREDMGIKMPKIKRIAEKDIWGFQLGTDTILFSRRPGVWKHQGIVTDGRMVYVTRTGGKVAGWAVAEATILKVDGKKIFASPGKKVTAAGPETVQDDGGEWRDTAAKRGME